MVMKDKLVKTNHKANYYLMRNISLVILAIASISFVIAVPTYIASSAKKRATAIAEENTSEKLEQEEKDGETEYEEYDDQTL